MILHTIYYQTSPPSLAPHKLPACDASTHSRCALTTPYFRHYATSNRLPPCLSCKPGESQRGRRSRYTAIATRCAPHAQHVRLLSMRFVNLLDSSPSFLLQSGPFPPAFISFLQRHTAALAMSRQLAALPPRRQAGLLHGLPPALQHVKSGLRISLPRCLASLHPAMATQHSHWRIAWPVCATQPDASWSGCRVTAWQHQYLRGRHPHTQPARLTTSPSSTTQCVILTTSVDTH